MFYEALQPVVQFLVMSVIFCRGMYRLVYLTPEYITHASSFLKEMDDSVGQLCLFVSMV